MGGSVRQPPDRAVHGRSETGASARRPDAIGLNAPITPREISRAAHADAQRRVRGELVQRDRQSGQDGNMVFAGHLNWYGVLPGGLLQHQFIHQG